MPNRIYVADSTNNRVLGWANAGSFTDGEPATLVIGQPDFQSINCNDGVAGPDINGIGADSLCDPLDLTVDSGGNLYVADAKDNRVLEYSTPFALGSPAAGLSASQVWGQSGSFLTTGCNFGTDTINASALCFPAGITVDPVGDLFVSDTNNNRVLEYDTGRSQRR